ncbi:hypothetical protein MLD38_023607 [Melastoma candidum]|uniref:Uncharacterized protein n=1 Tax=Melastoma candidum TaxID=119954 RepID=A0ACB9NPQ3_9MYRT|nr:hypothetical protein MLD38_023607 [Melastoma candidum]
MKAVVILCVALTLTVATLQADGEELNFGSREHRLIDRKTSAGTAAVMTNTLTSSTEVAASTKSSSESSLAVNGQNPNQGTYGDDTAETDPGSQRIIVDVMPNPKPRVP